jgi:hypothetical protein
MELVDYEYTVAQKHEGKWRAYRWLMLGGYAAFAVTYFLIAYLTRFIPIVAVLPLFIWMLVFFTYKYVNPEYKYKITAGHLTFYKNFGKKSYEILKIKLCDAMYIMPLENALEKIRDVEPKVTHSALPSKICTDSYIILYKNERNEPCAFIFKATSEALNSLRFYNKNTVMSTTEV